VHVQVRTVGGVASHGTIDGFGDGSCDVSLDLTPRGGRVMEASFCSAVGPRVQYRDQRTQEPTANRGRNFCEMPARAAAAGRRASDLLLGMGPPDSIRDSAWTDTEHHVSFPACNYCAGAAAAQRMAPVAPPPIVAHLQPREFEFGAIRQIGRTGDGY
jgi:hypothetical protein